MKQLPEVPESELIRYLDGLEQERRNSSALAMELCPSCTNPLVCKLCKKTAKCEFICVEFDSFWVTQVGTLFSDWWSFIKASKTHGRVMS